MMQLCETAVSEESFMKDDEPFHHGTKGTCMKFVSTGMFAYYYGLSSFDEQHQALSSRWGATSARRRSGVTGCTEA